MIVDCPSCDQSYELHDDQVTGKSVILSCPPCNTSWIVGPVGEAATNEIPNADDDDGETGQFHAPPVPQPVTAQRVRRGGDREHRDMFAQRRSSAPPPSSRAAVQRADASDSLPPVTVQAAPSRPSAPPGATTGERNEHSLLFSVEELKRAATMRPPAAAAPSAFVNSRRPSQSDDAGVIDLKPMLAQGGAMKSRTEPLYTPVGEMAPVGGFAMSVPPPRSTPLAVLAGIGVAVVIILGVSLGFALRSSPDEAAADVSAPLPKMALAAMPPTPETSLSSIVNDSSQKESTPTKDAISPMKMASAPASAKGAKGGAKYRWTPPARSTFTAKKNSAPPAPPAAKSGGKKGGSDPCGCGGNLQCAMKCGL
jgi:predicted Zn finger-like uncharacterized protein